MVYVFIKVSSVSADIVLNLLSAHMLLSHPEYFRNTVFQRRVFFSCPIEHTRNEDAWCLTQQAQTVTCKWKIEVQARQVSIISWRTVLKGKNRFQQKQLNVNAVINSFAKLTGIKTILWTSFIIESKQLISVEQNNLRTSIKPSKTINDV